ncbi:MAG: substrate-binding domain-containing protein, partial [Bacillota bacterium]
MKKLLITFLILVLALTTFGCAGSSDNTGGTEDTDSNKLQVAYINAADTDVFDAMRKDALVSVLDESKYEVTFYDSNKDIQKQLDYVDNAITDKVDLIILVPVDGEGAVPGVEAANAAGIPVICLGINAAGGDYTFV